MEASLLLATNRSKVAELQSCVDLSAADDSTDVSLNKFKATQEEWRKGMGKVLGLAGEEC